jgi:hypothetical protein
MESQLWLEYLLPDMPAAKSGNRKLTHYLGAGAAVARWIEFGWNTGGYLVTLGLTPGPSTPCCRLGALVFGFGVLPKFSLAGAVDGGRLSNWVGEARSECSSSIFGD